MVNYYVFEPKGKIFSFLWVLIVISFFNFEVKAQNLHSSVWHIGNKRLDFNTIPVIITDIVSPFLGINGSLALADENGIFILFASGSTKCLYNKNFQILTNGDNIDISSGLQRSIFIPVPNNDSLIYFFSDGKYSIIDIKNDIVIAKNVVFETEFLPDFISSVHHSNCNDIWLLSGNENKINIYLINKDTISINRSFVENFSSKMNFITNGKIFSYASYTSGSITISYGDFDRTNANFNTLDSYNYTDYELVYGSSFSSDATKLYYYMRKKNINKYDLIQINITAGIPDFNNFQIIATQTYTGPVPYNEMQLGLDGKIYQVFINKNKISIINSPNNLGTLCNYQDNAIPLSVGGNNIPNFISTWFSTNYCELDFFSENYCQTDNTQFYINNTDNIATVIWNFGDSQTSTELNPTHTYANASTYTVTLEVTFTDNSTQTITKTIEIIDKPATILIEHE